MGFLTADLQRKVQSRAIASQPYSCDPPTPPYTHTPCRIHYGRRASAKRMDCSLINPLTGRPGPILPFYQHSCREPAPWSCNITPPLSPPCVDFVSLCTCMLLVWSRGSLGAHLPSCLVLVWICAPCRPTAAIRGLSRRTHSMENGRCFVFVFFCFFFFFL